MIFELIINEWPIITDLSTHFKNHDWDNDVERSKISEREDKNIIEACKPAKQCRAVILKKRDVRNDPNVLQFYPKSIQWIINLLSTRV